jgi:hypothetical protein
LKNLAKLILLLSTVVLAGFLISLPFIIDNNSPDDDDEPLPFCVDNPLDSYPVNMTRLYKIFPLGSLNPPGHTYPSDHIYFYADRFVYPEGLQIFAPGNMTITSINMVNTSWDGGSNIEYSVYSSVCSFLTCGFFHIGNLTEELETLCGEFTSEQLILEYSIGSTKYQIYEKNLNLDVESGMQMGMAGKYGLGYDVLMTDSRVTNFWINESRGGVVPLHAVSPLDYFTPEIEQDLNEYLGDYTGGSVDPENFHGRLAYDVNNTAQGVWVRDGYDRSLYAADEHAGLALVRSNINQTRGAISIGNAVDSPDDVVWDCWAYFFTIEHSGYRNRDFEEVLFDEENPEDTYYYYILEQREGTWYWRAILLRMMSNQSVRIQFIDYGEALDWVEPTEDPRDHWDIDKTVMYVR